MHCLLPLRTYVLSAITLFILFPLLGLWRRLHHHQVRSQTGLSTVPMTKIQVMDAIGRPDRVLRDDGRMLVWEYSLTARRQWLYELGYCPISIWIGGCIIYPFTNLALEHQREYPQHVILVNDELCAWGPPGGHSSEAAGLCDGRGPLDLQRSRDAAGTSSVRKRPDQPGDH